MIEVVSDASVAVQWFHAEADEEVEASRAVLSAHRDRRVSLVVLDLTAYEVGNALLRGRAAASGSHVGSVLQAMDALCPAVRPDLLALEDAARLAEVHGLTMYDAAYAAVARARGATLVTLDRAILEAGLGVRPSALAERLGH